MAARRPARGADGSGRVTLDQVVELAVRHNLAEIEVEAAGLRIRVVREHAPVAGAARGDASPAAALPQAIPERAEWTGKLIPNGMYIELNASSRELLLAAARALDCRRLARRRRSSGR